MHTERTLFRTLAVLLSLCACSPAVRAQDNGEIYRWDIVKIKPVASNVVGGVGSDSVAITADGTAIASAADGSTMALTGSGTFAVDQPPRLEGPRIGTGASGGGTWVLRDSPTGAFAGAIIGSGAYTVTEFIAFNLASGAFIGNVTDSIGTSSDIRAGLAILRVKYSDGSRGILTVSCRLVGTPQSVLQGIRVTKGFVQYSGEASTLFHVLR